MGDADRGVVEELRWGLISGDVVFTGLLVDGEVCVLLFDLGAISGCVGFVGLALTGTALGVVGGFLFHGCKDFCIFLRTSNLLNLIFSHIRCIIRCPNLFRRLKIIPILLILRRQNHIIAPQIRILKRFSLLIMLLHQLLLLLQRHLLGSPHHSVM